MTTHLKFRVEKLKKYLTFFSQFRTRQTAPVDELALLEPADPRFDAPGDDGPWQSMQLNDEWGGRQQWAYFRAKVTVPQSWPKRIIELRLSPEIRYLGVASDDKYPAGPEGQVFVDGQRVGAIDQQHKSIRFHFKAGKTYDLRAIFFAARCDCRHRLAQFELAWVDEPSEKLYHDLRVLLDVIDQLDEAQVIRERLITIVDSVMKKLDFREHTRITFPAEMKRDPERETFYRSVTGAQKLLDDAMAQLRDRDGVPEVACVGHAHIDLGWLWEIAQTHHKCVRTFGTQCALIESHPDWIFQQSSPQAYQWIEQDAPGLFDQIRRYVRAGRWEADGATWVEMDTNMPAGESLVRQLLYGKRYFKEKLGVDSRMLWLPDVFGYSAALPQLLRLAGVDGFVTSKISWSQFNRFPQDTFRWRGIDGSEVPTHFITTPCSSSFLTYNARLTVQELTSIWKEYRQKDQLLRPLMSFGYGDGGGGPTVDMLETGRRMAEWGAKVGIPQVKYEKAGTLMRRVAMQAERLPAWDGELYLEFHRGTYTSQAWLKRVHRKNEIRLHNLEWLSVLASRCGHTTDKATLDVMWQDLLLVEFHDILPGSSVQGMYDEVRPMMATLAKRADELTEQAARAIADNIDTGGMAQPVVLFNTLSWDRSDPVQLSDGSWRDGVTVPAGGWCVIDAASQPSSDGDLSVREGGRVMENRFWRLRLDEQGRIVDLHDKQAGRDVFTSDRPGNQWQVFEDRSLDFEAWDIDHYYVHHPLEGPTCDSIEIVERGPVRVAVQLHWTMPLVGKGPQSTITQRIVIYAADPRIDFETRADWYDHHTILKVAFPTDIRATEATYQVQFGHVQRPTHRNTSWDYAKFEVCAHRFADLSEHGYGLALLNDCKYGHDVHEGVMRLTCLMSPQAPNGTADRGEHVFTYALLPHTGSFQDAGVIRAAAELNVPMLAYPVRSSVGELPQCESAVTCDSEAVVIDTLKPAEDGHGMIVRLYESFGSHANVKLTFPQELRGAHVVDLLEAPRHNDVALQHEGDRLTMRLRPFQVVSLRIRY